jgi:hypothetical protein
LKCDVGAAWAARDVTCNEDPGDDENEGEKVEDHASSAGGVHGMNSL